MSDDSVVITIMPIMITFLIRSNQ